MKFKKIFLGFIGFLIFYSITNAPGIAEELDAQKLLQQVDENLWADTKFISGRRIIDNGRKVRTLKQDSWMEGVTRSYSHYKSCLLYTSPSPRDS